MAVTLDELKKATKQDLASNGQFINLCKVVTALTGETNPEVDILPSGNAYIVGRINSETNPDHITIARQYFHSLPFHQSYELVRIANLRERWSVVG